MTNIHDLKLRLLDVPGIDTLTMTMIGGRQVYGFDGLIAAVDPAATDEEIEAAIRTTADMARFGRSPEGKQTASRLPVPSLAPEPRKDERMTTPKPGSFAASIRAMMDEARQGVAKAREDGLAKVGEAVGKLGEAKAAVTHVAGQMAATIESEAADVMAELGQISNSLGGEND